MACNTSDDKSEEMRRRNITKFLEGLLEEDSRDGSCITTPSPQILNTSTKISLDKVSPAKRLLECELAAYSDYPGLLEANMKNVLKTPFSIHNIKHNDDLVRIYTGIPVAKGFFNLAKRFTKSGMKYYKGWIVGQLTMKQQLLMTLMKLKLGMDDIHLSHRFNCSLETVTNTVLTWLLALHKMLFDVLVNNLGEQWTIDTPVILDTVNIYSKTPDNPNVPHKTPLEPYMAAVASRTDGIVIHAGDLYVWTNDKVDVIEECEFFSRLQPGCVIALDSDVCDFIEVPNGVFALSFDLGNDELLSPRREVEKRFMEFKALRCMPVGLERHVNIVWQVVVALTNFCRMKAVMSA